VIILKYFLEAQILNIHDLNTENLKKGGIVEKRGEEETKSMPQVPVDFFTNKNRIKCSFTL
jgi:hypothetical protein